MNQSWKHSLYRSAHTYSIEEPNAFVKFLFNNFPKIPHLLIPFGIVIHVRIYVDFEIFLWIIGLLLSKFWTLKNL